MPLSGWALLVQLVRAVVHVLHGCRDDVLLARRQARGGPAQALRPGQLPHLAAHLGRHDRRLAAVGLGRLSSASNVVIAHNLKM